MVYVLTFIEGILTFISPCFLPLIPVYVTFLTGTRFDGTRSDSKNNSVITNALGFIIGFSLIFLLMGAAAATFGMFVRTHMNIINVIGGIFVILFGVHFIGLLNIPFLNFSRGIGIAKSPSGFFPSVLFGIVFSIGWTPCVSAYLGSALMKAANSRTSIEGTLMLATFSLGLGLPFLLSAVFIKELRGAFGFIKRHYKIINIISGIFLILMGLLMMTGKLNILFSII